MARVLAKAWTAAVAALIAGCLSGPLQENPVLLRADRVAATENPVYVPLGPPAYPAVFEKVIDVLDDYFEIAYANRYDGRIETHPRVAPGIGQPWKPGSPDVYQRLYATLQTIRHRAIVLITVADDGGFFIDVKVFKELEDLPRPSQSAGIAVAFQSTATVERQFEVVESGVFDSSWIPIGRDKLLEQVILARLAHESLPNCPNPAPAPPPRP
jgi:hypothetical protein